MVDLTRLRPAAHQAPAHRRAHPKGRLSPRAQLDRRPATRLGVLGHQDTVDDQSLAGGEFGVAGSQRDQRLLLLGREHKTGPAGYGSNNLTLGGEHDFAADHIRVSAWQWGDGAAAGIGALALRPCRDLVGHR